MPKLLPYQQPSADRLENAFRNPEPPKWHPVGGTILPSCVDGSDTGTGKSYVAAEVAKRLGHPVGVICPKVSRPMWKRVLKDFKIKPLFVENYELLRAGNTKWASWDGERWIWNRESVPEGSFLIWDEGHRLKGIKSQNALMLRDSIAYHNLILSATLATSPLETRALLHVLGICSWDGFYGHLARKGFKKVSVERNGRRINLGFKASESANDAVMKLLHDEIFQKRGTRIQIDTLGDAFPETQITAECYDFGSMEEMAGAYKAMEDALQRLSDKEAVDKESPLTELTRARQRTELLKIPGICSIANDFLEQGHSVLVFVNFRDTLTALCEKLGTTCAIYGDQDPAERQKNIDAFQDNSQRIIVINNQAGSESISLHDTHGGHPRVSLISPPQSASLLRQIFGRPHRAGGKSKSLQRLLFAAGTVEEEVYARVEAKLDRLDLLNDGDLMVSNLPVPAETPTTPEPAQAVVEPAPVGPVAPVPPAPGTPQTPETLTTSTEAAIVTLTTSTEAAVASLPPERPHATHSPSSLLYKAQCEGFRNDPTRDKTAANRGTIGHELVEKESKILPPGYENDESLLKAVNSTLTFLQKFYALGGVLHREIKLPVLDQFGYIDLLVELPTSGHLIDYKFAHNFYNADSPQFWGYAIGIWDQFPNINELNVWVAHPFLDEVDHVKWTRDADYDRLTAMVANIIHRAKNPDPSRFKIGHYCAYCGHIGTCPAQALLATEIANRYAKEHNKFVLPAGSMHGSEISDPTAFSVLLRLKPFVESAVEGWSRAAFKMREEDGIDIPGFDIFERKGTRSISNTMAAYSVIKDLVTAEELLEKCSIGIGDFETVYRSKIPRGKKGQPGKDAAVAALMDKLQDVDALTSGAPVRFLKALKDRTEETELPAETPQEEKPNT